MTKSILQLAKLSRRINRNISHAQLSIERHPGDSKKDKEIRLEAGQIMAFSRFAALEIQAELGRRNIGRVAFRCSLPKKVGRRLGLLPPVNTPAA